MYHRDFLRVWYKQPEMPLIECIPNISEGRRPAVVQALVDSVRWAAGTRLLDASADASHNRTVLTFAGDVAAVRDAVLALFTVAVQRIDLRDHRGEHPRIGAVDVVPFVPLEGATMADCVALARATAEEVASEFGVPVFLYEEAARVPVRRNLAAVRRGGFEGLAARMSLPGGAPDAGPAMPHPSAGATAIGARGPLVAFNVNLNDDRIAVADAIAHAVRESSGGLPCVKAMPVTLADRGLVQVSMNLTDYRRTSIEVAFDAVEREALRHGVTVLESEIIGLVPEAALSPDAARRLRVREFSRDRILEQRLRATAPRQ